MLTLLSRYILHSTRVGRVAGVSKEFAASIFGVVEEVQVKNFFETSATRSSALFQNPNK
jgi:hypothetical protein